MPDIAGYILHLERAHQRADNARLLASSLPVSSAIWHAVDARSMSDAQRAACVPTSLFRPRYPFALGETEIAIFHSYRAMWQDVLDRGLDAGLILEDDVTLDAPAFAAAFEIARAHVDDHDSIQFSWRRLPGQATELATGDGGARLLWPEVTPLGTQAQLVSAKACARFLDATTAFDRPVDVFLQSHWQTGTRLACVAPGGVHHEVVAFGASTVQVKRKRSVAGLVAREVRRAVYRAGVKRLSQRAARG